MMRRGLLTAVAVFSVAVPAVAASAQAVAAERADAVAAEKKQFLGIGTPVPTKAMDDAREKMGKYVTETGENCAEKSWDVRLGNIGEDNVPQYWVAILTAECGS